MFKASVVLISSNKILLKFALNRILVYEAAFLYWRIYQIILKDAGLTAISLGVIYSIFQAILFFVLWNSAFVQRKMGAINFILGSDRSFSCGACCYDSDKQSGFAYAYSYSASCLGDNENPIS